MNLRRGRVGMVVVVVVGDGGVAASAKLKKSKSKSVLVLSDNVFHGSRPNSYENRL